MENNRAVFDSDCHCDSDECLCLTHSEIADEHRAEQEPLILVEPGKCPCNDPAIALKLNTEIQKFLVSKFQSKKFLRKVFGTKANCISHGVLIKTKIALSCNPSPDEPKQTNFNPLGNRRKRVRRFPRLPQDKR